MRKRENLVKYEETICSFVKALATEDSRKIRLLETENKEKILFWVSSEAMLANCVTPSFFPPLKKPPLNLCFLLSEP